MQVIAVGGVSTITETVIVGSEACCCATSTVGEVHTARAGGWARFTSIVCRVAVCAHRTICVTGSRYVVSELWLAEVAHNAFHNAVFSVSRNRTKGYTLSILEEVQVNTAVA